MLDDSPEHPTEEEKTMARKLDDLKVAELKQLAAQMGLSCSGLKKAELLELVKDGVLSGKMPNTITKSE